jgi:hypothetical protein
VSVTECVSIVVALVALAVSVTSLVNTVRPASLTLTTLSELTEVAGGGTNGFPACTEIRAQVALTNVAAKAGLLVRVACGVPIVNQESLKFAVGAEPRSVGFADPLVQLDGVEFAGPQTVEAGDVRNLTLNIGLAGDVRSARFTRALPGHGPDREAIARLIRDIDSVSIPFVATYRRGQGLFAQREAVGNVLVQGVEFKRAAVAYWAESDPDLAAIVNEGFGPKWGAEKGGV